MLIKLYIIYKKEATRQMDKKIRYKKPEIEVTLLMRNDVIATSGGLEEVDKNLPKDENTWQNNW